MLINCNLFSHSTTAVHFYYFRFRTIITSEAIKLRYMIFGEHIIHF